MPRTEWPDGYRMAAEIIKRHPEVFKDVPPLADILFVWDSEATPKSKGNLVLARVAKIPGKFEDFVVEGNKIWMLEWFAANVGNMTLNQKQVLMAHELQHFEFDGEKGVHRLRGHDVEEFHLIADRFGTQWTSPAHGDVPDILARDFSWGKQGQARLGLADEVVENRVKASPL